MFLCQAFLSKYSRSSYYSNQFNILIPSLALCGAVFCFVIKNLKILIDFIKKNKDKYNSLYNDYLVDKTNILQEQTNKKEKEYAEIIKKSTELNKKMSQTISEQNKTILEQDKQIDYLQQKIIAEDKSKINIKPNFIFFFFGLN